MINAARIGDPPQIIRGELIKRGYKYAQIARELEVQPQTIWMIVERRTRSRRIENYINSILEQPLPTN